MGGVDVSMFDNPVPTGPGEKRKDESGSELDDTMKRLKYSESEAESAVGRRTKRYTSRSAQETTPVKRNTGQTHKKQMGPQRQHGYTDSNAGGGTGCNSGSNC